ncbi:MAG TPA: elongation factor P [Bryobacteraceae bacterium]|nr:elongation factor P [Bryobacteraceae bacterium]
MVSASQLRGGMAIRYEGQTYKVITAEYHPGQGKMGGVTHASLKNLSTGTVWEHSFRADLKIEDLPVEKQNLEFLYSDADNCCLMDPQTYEQVEIPTAAIGEQAKFLQPQMQIPVEFVEGRPVSVDFPEIIEVRVAETAPPQHQQQDSTRKPATLENGVQIMVPQFIKTGEIIRLDLQTLRYVDRAKPAAR